MKKITDERLILQNLKNIRVAFVFQSLAIIGVLVYQTMMQGFEVARSNPLWLILIVTGVILSYLSLSISVDHEEKSYRHKSSQYFHVVLRSLALGIIFGLIIKLGPEGTTNSGLIVGSVFFICSLIPFSIVHILRKKRSEDVE